MDTIIDVRLCVILDEQIEVDNTSIIMCASVWWNLAHENMAGRADFANLRDKATVITLDFVHRTFT